MKQCGIALETIPHRETSTATGAPLGHDCCNPKFLWKYSARCWGNFMDGCELVVCILEIVSKGSIIHLEILYSILP